LYNFVKSFVLKNLVCFIIISFVVSTTTYAQEFGSNVLGTENSNVKKESVGFNPNVSVSLGSSFASFGMGYNMFGTFVMPEFEMPVSKKLSVKVGLGYSNLFLSSPEQTGNIFQQDNQQYGTVYVSGLYHVNSRLIITGTAFKTFSLAPVKNEINPRALDFSNEGIQINVDYKVTDNFRINAGFSYQKKSPYNYYYKPGGFNMNPSPFYNYGPFQGF